MTNANLWVAAHVGGVDTRSLCIPGAHGVQVFIIKIGVVSGVAFLAYLWLEVSCRRRPPFCVPLALLAMYCPEVHEC